MKRHDLLFRYLDGEITRDEDKILREIIKEDPELGEDLQSFLEIDYYINKSNEEFDYPEEFINQVGNQISNRIVFDKDIKKMRSVIRRQYTMKFIVVPAIIAVFFFAFLIKVQNPEIDFFTSSTNNSNSSIFDINNSNYDIVTKSEKQSIIRKPNDYKYTNSINLQPHKHNEFNSKSQEINTETLATNNDATEVSIQSFIEQKYISMSDNQDNETKQQISPTKDAINQTNRNFNQLQLNNPWDNNSYNEQFALNPKLQNFIITPFNSSLIPQSNIQINSLIGTDIYRVGVNSTNQIVNSFTQSFAAEIAKGSSLGLEAGFMEFKSNTKKITEISSKSMKNGFNGLTILEFENNSSENPVLIRVEGVQSINQKVVWVGFFYERNFLEFNDFNFSSRFSLGLSDNGMISSLKLIGKYNITKQIIITFGSDAKIFEGSFNENQINRINSTFSLIYGVKFAF